MQKIILTGLLPEEINTQLHITPSFRGRQIFKWIGNGVSSFNEMTNISVGLREQLEQDATLSTSSVSRILRDTDGTVKLQITLRDGFSIETVLLTDSSNRKTACVSCQAGCAMKCAFCQTGQLGLARNLDASEIVEEFLFLEKEAGKLDNIVFMGMGEPMQNLSEIRKAIAVLTSKEGRSLSGRRITVSTCGILKGIYDLADNGPLIRLAVSLTTADPELREKLMPAARANPLPELKKAILYYAQKTGKRVTIEAALLGGVNTGDESARRMVDFASGINVNLNLIPWNPVPGLPFTEPSAEECRKFIVRMEQAGLNATLRTRRGTKIGGACGQLGKTTIPSA